MGFGDTLCIRNAATDPRGQEAETSLGNTSDWGNINLAKIKNAILAMSASDENVKAACQGPRHISGSACLLGTIPF